MDKERWNRFGLAKQLGNIASEINQARHWQEKSDTNQMQKSLSRALHLLALSIDNHASPGRRELTRFYEVLASHYTNRSPYPISLHSLEKFCLSHLGA